MHRPGSPRTRGATRYRGRSQDGSRPGSGPARGSGAREGRIVMQSMQEYVYSHATMTAVHPIPTTRQCMPSVRGLVRL